jgi:PhzF family phenazine biosynthesis protein
MRRQPYYEYHSFPDGDAPFTGNPAGVCPMEEYPADAAMLGVAASNKHAETAFLIPGGGADAWRLRWFTPAVEVDLCGHATLAAAAAVFDLGLVRGDAAAFDTRSGRLTVTREGSVLCMDFPAILPGPAEPDSAIATALGAQPQEFHEIRAVHAARYCMAVLGSESEVARLKPDIGALRRLGVNVIATARGESADFVSRFFAPASGIDEDPVTGSAHCTLAPYWADRLGRARLSARQIGPRPGALAVEARGDRVALIGHAAKYLEGEIFF